MGSLSTQGTLVQWVEPHQAQGSEEEGSPMVLSNRQAPPLLSPAARGLAADGIKGTWGLKHSGPPSPLLVIKGEVIFSAGPASLSHDSPLGRCPHALEPTTPCPYGGLRGGLWQDMTFGVTFEDKVK